MHIRGRRCKSCRHLTEAGRSCTPIYEMVVGVRPCTYCYAAEAKGGMRVCSYWAHIAH